MKPIERILLIQPPYTIRPGIPKNCQIPLGLAYLAATLKDDYEVTIIDAIVEGYEREEALGSSIRYGLSFDQLRGRIKSFSPDLVGISCLFSTQWPNAQAVAGLAKELDREVTVVIGGAHPSAIPEEVLAHEEIDYVIVGEGEGVLKKLIQSLNKGGKGEEIDGVAFRDGRGAHQGRKNFIADLDTIPFPAWSHLSMERYFAINKPHGGGRHIPNTVMITSRGCPYRCIFCSIHTVWGKAFRARSISNVIDEMEALIDQYGLKEIQFEDDNLLFDRDRAERLFEEMTDRKFNLGWTAPNGIAVEKLDRGLLQKMKESGCYSLFLAIESGTEETLKDIIKKTVPLSRIKSLVKEAKALGIDTYGFFVVGLPGERETQIKKTFSFAAGLSLDGALFFYATPYPGTSLYTQAWTQGLFKDIDYSRLSVDHATMGTGTLSRDDLENLVEREKRIYPVRSLLHGWLEHPLSHLRNFISHPSLSFKRLRDYLK